MKKHTATTRTILTFNELSALHNTVRRLLSAGFNRQESMEKGRGYFDVNYNHRSITFMSELDKVVLWEVSENYEYSTTDKFTWSNNF
jgi:hypothetical protein